MNCARIWITLAGLDASAAPNHELWRRAGSGPLKLLRTFSGLELTDGCLDYLDIDLNPETVYMYTVRSVGRNGDVLATSRMFVLDTMPAALPAPAGLPGEAVSTPGQVGHRLNPLKSTSGSS